MMTAVQPAARAAPSFRVIMADGKFQGVRIDLGYDVRQGDWLGSWRQDAHNTCEPQSVSGQS